VSKDQSESKPEQNEVANQNAMKALNEISQLKHEIQKLTESLNQTKRTSEVTSNNQSNNQSELGTVRTQQQEGQSAHGFASFQQNPLLAGHHPINTDRASSKLSSEMQFNMLHQHADHGHKNNLKKLDLQSLETASL